MNFSVKGIVYGAEEVTSRFLKMVVNSLGTTPAYGKTKLLDGQEISECNTSLIIDESQQRRRPQLDSQPSAESLSSRMASLADERFGVHRDEGNGIIKLALHHNGGNNVSVTNSLAIISTWDVVNLRRNAMALASEDRLSQQQQEQHESSQQEQHEAQNDENSLRLLISVSRELVTIQKKKDQWVKRRENQRNIHLLLSVSQSLAEIKRADDKSQLRK